MASGNLKNINDFETYTKFGIMTHGIGYSFNDSLIIDTTTGTDMYYVVTNLTITATANYDTGYKFSVYLGVPGSTTATRHLVRNAKVFGSRTVSPTVSNSEPGACSLAVISAKAPLILKRTSGAEKLYIRAHDAASATTTCQTNWCCTYQTINTA